MQKWALNQPTQQVCGTTEIVFMSPSGVRVELVMKLMGLFHARGTLVGNEINRGISGGEKKRLTTAEQVGGWESCQDMLGAHWAAYSVTGYAAMQASKWMGSRIALDDK
jgi:hypothetical protein